MLLFHRYCKTEHLAEHLLFNSNFYLPIGVVEGVEPALHQ